MKSSCCRSQKGSVLLVALCFVTVLGISLASYIAVCSRAMQISNRTAQTDLSRQLAEMGLEEGLRAFNKNDWSDWSNSTVADWTLSGTTATCDITFPAGTFGQGVTGSIKIRIDNYNTNHVNANYSSSATYRIGDLVGSGGTWYRSVRNSNTNQTPSATNLTWWISNPMPWTWRKSSPYLQYEMVNEKGIWYRCIAAHTSHVSTFSNDAASWTAIPTQRVWASTTAYSIYDVVSYTNASGDVGLYRCTAAHTSSASFSADAANWSSNVQTVSLAWTSGTVYTRGAIVYYIGSGNNTWYYCKQAGTSSTAPASDTTMWAPIYSDGGTPATLIDTLNNGTTYYPGDYAYRTSTSLWYRCHTTHNYNSWGSDQGNWTSTNAIPYLQLIDRGVPSQTSNNIMFSLGTTWYRYMGSRINALTGNMHAWVSGNKYSLGDAVYYSTRWYRCIVAHTSSGSIPPSNTTYWAAAPAHSSTWDSGRQYSAYDTVSYNGVWYLSLQNTNSGRNPATATTYWIGANTTTASYQWSPATAYASGDYKCYGGVWYRCIAATTANAGHNPNNTTYWSASWANGWGMTTGAPVVYAEGTVNIAGSAPIKIQLRAPIALAPLFPNAVAANASTVTASSGGTVDSYDSASGLSYASQVNTSTNYSAVVASGYTAGTAITLTSTVVKGYLAAPSTSTAPYAPLYSTGGTVKGPTSPASPNVDPTRITRSPYIPKFDTIPGGAGGLATNWTTTHKGTPLSLEATTNVGTPGDPLPSRYYYNGNLTIGTATIGVLRINGPVILYINGNLLITASGATGRIEMSSAGSAEIHVTGTFRADAGGAGILSYNTDPKSLIIISDTTSTTSHYYSEGVNPLYGTVYVPYSTSNSGFYNDNNATQIYGAVSANKVTYSGANMNIHYDTSLRHATFGGVDRPYAVTEWRELSDVSERATMP
jgi:hypothetical protein